MGLFPMYFLLLLGLGAAGCSAKKSSDPNEPATPTPKKTAAAIQAQTSPTPAASDEDTSTPPAFASHDLGTGFNRPMGSAGTAADPANIMIRVLHTNYYRPVFLNLIEKPEAFAIYQPMPITQVRKTGNNAQIDSYYIAGHAYSAQLGYPNHATLMLAYNTDPNVLAPPKSYSRIWYKEVSQKANDLFAKCEEMGGGHDGSYPNMSATTMCQGLGSSVSSSFGVTIFNYQQLFDILGVFFWKPIPYEGFQCLGHISSNGSGNMPVSVLDVNQQFTGLGTSYNPSITVSAMYCVKNDYVVEGKIGNILLQSADKSLILYEIIPKDSNGFDSGNLFYAQSCPSRIPANCPVKEKVYVLNKNYLIDVGVEGSSR
jgi:hypothetical protein